jgi:hypothetical protein
MLTVFEPWGMESLNAVGAGWFEGCVLLEDFKPKFSENVTVGEESAPEYFKNFQFSSPVEEVGEVVEEKSAMV